MVSNRPDYTVNGFRDRVNARLGAQVEQVNASKGTLALQVPPRTEGGRPIHLVDLSLQLRRGTRPGSFSGAHAEAVKARAEADDGDKPGVGRVVNQVGPSSPLMRAVVVNNPHQVVSA